MKIIRINTNGSYDELDFKEGMTNHDYAKLIGDDCEWIEHAGADWFNIMFGRDSRPLHFLLDERGKHKGLEGNFLATMMYNHEGDVIMGNALLLATDTNEEGDLDFTAIPDLKETKAQLDLLKMIYGIYD